jgi:gamma-glutamylputrescine oxidase
MNLSYWETKTYFSDIDILIVGSGIVGLTTALELKNKNKKLKILVIDRGLLPSGASTKNAGFACFGSISELIDDLNRDSLDNVLSLVEKRWKGLQKLRKILSDKAIDFQNNGGYELFTDKTSYINCAEKIDFFNTALFEITGSKKVYANADEKIKTFEFKNTHHLIENTLEGQIDTGKMMYSLTKKVQESGVTILNGIELKDLQEEEKGVKVMFSDNIQFKVNKVLIATNGFARELLPDIDVNPARAQVLITSPIKDLRIKGTFHYDQGYYYFRNIDNRILFGGGRNLDFTTENTSTMDLTKLIQEKLEELLNTMIIPNHKYKIEQRWSGIMGLGNTKNTIIKSISENIFCAVRMGGMGVALGSYVGEQAAHMIEKKL